MFTSLSRVTLPDQISETLMQFIDTNKLKPGDMLPSEARLAQDFGVSRPVVREALKSLAGQGVVEIVNGKGAVIKPMDDAYLRLFFQRAIQIEPATLVELMEVRKPLEVQSAMLAAQRRTPEDMAQLKATVTAMGECLHDLEVYADLDVQFHLQVVAAAHNTMMHYLISSIRASLKNVIQEGLRRTQTRKQLEEMQARHEEIANAIEQRDAEAAGRIMGHHFDGAVMKFIKNAAHEDPSSSASSASSASLD